MLKVDIHEEKKTGLFMSIQTSGTIADITAEVCILLEKLKESIRERSTSDEIVFVMGCTKALYDIENDDLLNMLKVAMDKSQEDDE